MRPNNNWMRALGSVEREDHARETFMLAATVVTELTRTIYSQLLVDEPNLGRRMIPEALDYCGACLTWARVIALKVKNQQPLTLAERTLQDIFLKESFNVPEPLRSFYLTFGKVTTVLGTHLTPTFPPLPEEVIPWNNIDIPGMFGNGPYNADTQNLYEELPSIGVHVAALITAQNQAVGAWAPPGLPEGWVATHRQRRTQINPTSRESK